MIKFLILLVVGFLFYREVKKWMFKNQSYHGKVSSDKTGEIDDVMIKDPYCGVYFPQRNGVSLNENGQDIYFCSEECKEKYMAQKD